MKHYAENLTPKDAKMDKIEYCKRKNKIDERKISCVSQIAYCNIETVDWSKNVKIVRFLRCFVPYTVLNIHTPTFCFVNLEIGNRLLFR